LHILCEKPMTTDVGEARALAIAARRAALKGGKAFLVNNTANWRPYSRLIFERLVQQQELGTIRHVNAYFGVPLGWLFEDPANIG
jgi:predicted dehydrogenase